MAMQTHQTYCKWRPPGAVLKAPPPVTTEMIGLMSPPPPTAANLNLALTGDDPKLSSVMTTSLAGGSITPTSVLIPQRPTSLGLGGAGGQMGAGVPIETPSVSIPSFNYDAGICSLLEVGTGFTPTTDTPLKPVLASTICMLETPTVPDTPSTIKALAQL